jgi:hypothetical protein
MPMKTKLFFTILTVLSVSFGCKKLDSNNPDVESYIDQLKNGKYSPFELPEFSTSDISALLIYRNDTTTIRNVPASPISSYLMMKCKLGMIVLWNIESIRAVEINSEKLIGRFPSQNPLLALRDDPSVWAFDEDSHLTAAKAYYDWWKSNPLFTNKMKIDPLKDTKYVWH